MLLFYTYMLIAYLPAITVVLGIPFLIIGIILLVIIVAVFLAVSLKAKAWKSWVDEHSSNKDYDE